MAAATPTPTPTHECDHCGKVSSSLLRCTQCQSVWYCNRTCQSLAWNRSSSGSCDNDNNGNGKEGHRKVCRRLRKLMITAAANNSDASSLPIAKMEASQASPGDAMVELMHHVQSIDCNEAYKQMCLAQDEIQRLQSQITQEMSTQQLESKNEVPREDDMPSQLEMLDSDTTCAEAEPMIGDAQKGGKSGEGRTSGKTKPMKPNSGAQKMNKHSVVQTSTISGSWLEQGGKCSIEYLPNVKCYSITLTTSALPIYSGNDSLVPCIIPRSKDELHFTMAPIVRDEENDPPLSPLSVSYYEAKLFQLKDQEEHDVLLSLTLPSPSFSSRAATTNTHPSARISMDANSISLRIQLLTETPSMAMDGMDYVGDHLLGMDESSSLSSSFTTNVSDLNTLRCRSCQNPIVGPPPPAAQSNSNGASTNDGNNVAATIRSALPLPSGYWDDISDYLICYDGQATVDFTSSTTNAIRRTVLEDDAILVLHRQDILVADNGSRRGGGVCTLGRVKGYGEHSSSVRLNNDTPAANGGGGSGAAMMSVQAWRDKAAATNAMTGEKPKTVTCANCCTTLGYVSDHESNTYRFYKHLLDCGRPIGDNDGGGGIIGADAAGAFSKKYTCASFLAREMVRYAESEAIYTFIVGVSDENDWTRVHSQNNEGILLLRMLSWDTPMATTTVAATDESLRFQKVVKVIFEEASDKDELTNTALNGDDQLEWTWRSTDFCCPPNSNAAESSNNFDETRTISKASSIRIFFSKQEWTELRDALICGSCYFSETVKDAVVMTKLGLLSPDNGNDLTEQKQTASLSILPLVN